MELTRAYVNDPRFQEMKKYIQHGKVTTYDHSMSVTEVSYRLNRRLGLGADEEVLISSAMLHDFFLYDWHTDVSDWTHSYKHPMIASENASKYFNIGPEEQHAIQCHMFPYTFWRIPKTRVAWILTMADKYCSLKETLFHRKG